MVPRCGLGLKRQMVLWRRQFNSFRRPAIILLTVFLTLRGVAKEETHKPRLHHRHKESAS